MQEMVIGIKNNQKAQILIEFLKQLDFIEIIESPDDGKDFTHGSQDKTNSLQSPKKVLLNAPVLSRKEIKDIEQMGKGVIQNLEVL